MTKAVEGLSANFAIERRIRPHVVTHVRDGDDEAPALAMGLAVNSVVEVARVGTVDRDEAQLAQVLAPFPRWRNW